MADTTTIIFSVMTVSALFIIGLSCLIYKCRRDPNKRPFPDNRYPETYGISDDSRIGSNYRDDTISEEDQLMIPIDREDTIDSLRQQLSQVNVANVRYIQIASVETGFRIKDGVEPREYIEGDMITFRDIAIGFVDGIPEKLDNKTNLTQRASVIYQICAKQLKCESITEISQIHECVVYLCKIIIRLRYNKKKNIKNVVMRDDKSEDFKSDLLPIIEWIWIEKMNRTDMNIRDFSQKMTRWIQEIESPEKEKNEIEPL